MIKNDRWIREMAEKGMIKPFESNQVKKGISYGVSSYGYDFRISREFKVFTNLNSIIVDPKKFDHNSFVDIECDECIIPPNSFALARTVEYFRIPRNIMTIALGKSTYARVGIIINTTPFEPEWEGHATIEISNTTPLPAKIYANEGIGQLLFLSAYEEVRTKRISKTLSRSYVGEVCQQSYADKKGKYQGQKGITTAKTIK